MSHMVNADYVMEILEEKMNELKEEAVANKDDFSLSCSFIDMSDGVKQAIEYLKDNIEYGM